MLVLFALTLREGVWSIRVDPPTNHGKLHVHIWRKKGRGTYSWNDDGSRHDKCRFPNSENDIKAAKRLAAKHLGIPESHLSFITMLSGVKYVEIHVHNSHAESPDGNDDHVVLDVEIRAEVALLRGRGGRIHVLVIARDQP